MKNLKRKRRRRRGAAVLILLMLAFAGSSLYQFREKSKEYAEQESTENNTVQGDYVAKETPSDKVLEDKSIYDEDEEDSVVNMYLTVRRGNEEDHTNHTWAEINEYSAYYYEEHDLPRYNCEALLQIGEEDAPAEEQFGYREEASNATVQVRGQASSNAEQKNYKIRIKAGKGGFRGQRTIALNKHMSDPFRFLNKLAYDLIKEIPQMVGARTQFVHLYVKDETEGEDGTFEDYGLYTWVEQMNKTYLANHGLDNRGQLYKVNFFEWYRYEDVIRMEDDPDYDPALFEEYLEIKGDSDHTKLLEVLEAVNDYAIPIESTVEEYFDVENICYWAAFQLLIGNYDTGSRNLFFYSPLNTKKWYIISWDNDAAFHRTYYEETGHTEGMSWERGLTQLVHVVLFNRMFREEKYREALDAAVLDLREHYLTREIIAEKINCYRQVTERFLFTEPDITYAKVKDRDAYEKLVQELPSEVELNYQYYLESRKKPWPFYVDVPEVRNGSLYVNWNASYDVNGENITYTVTLAKDYEFQDVVESKEGIRIPGTELELPEAGDYFLRIRARNASGYEQDCFDYYTVEGVGKVYGAYAFSIDEEGRVTVGEDEKV